MANKFWYLPLEIQKSRYTEQLCGKWIPDAFEKVAPDSMEFEMVEGDPVPSQIKVGHVLDATGRGKYSLTQVNKFLTEIEKGNVKDGDVIYLQDFWTPGVEAIWYALDLYGIDTEVYSMLHAQSVDEYDFTHKMKDWMRPYELGLDRASTGIFVGSSIHKDQLREAGFQAPIHTVSLPLGRDEVVSRMGEMTPYSQKENSVVFSSRLDWEKQPRFMMDVAKEFLKRNPDWNWYVTTSGKEFRSSEQDIVDKLYQLNEEQPRFKPLANLSKEEYYDTLKRSKIQFNSSLQDYVSWTLLEASVAGCNVVYPDFRSFPECVPDELRYGHQDKDDAVRKLEQTANVSFQHPEVGQVSHIADTGRLLEMYVMTNRHRDEVNVWKDYQDWDRKLRD